MATKLQVARLNQQIALQNADYARTKAKVRLRSMGWEPGNRRGRLGPGKGASGLDELRLS